MKFTMREYFQSSTDFNEAYGIGGNNNVDSFLSDPSSNNNNNNNNGSGTTSGSKKKSGVNTGGLTLWKFLEFDKLTNTQLNCINDQSSNVMNCLADCKNVKCEKKCSREFVGNVQKCLNEKPEEAEEEAEEVEEVEEEIRPRFKINQMNNIPNEGSYLGNNFARFTPIEGDTYKVNVQAPIYPDLAENLLEKKKSIRGKNASRIELDLIAKECRQNGGFLRGGNHSKNC
jgi:hypothetical protein